MTVEELIEELRQLPAAAIVAPIWSDGWPIVKVVYEAGQASIRTTRGKR